MNAEPPKKTRVAASSALERFRILDLTRVRSGPTAARQLADWGADVISVEMPEALAAGDAVGGPREGPDFQNLHRNKRSITVNLKTAEGRDILKRLAEDADVLIENFRPDVKHRLGIDYEALAEINPRLVYASISGFGQDGPYRDRPGFDQIAQGMGGLMSITGHPDQGPVRAGIPVADLSAGIFCAFGILVALLEREVSGKGQWLCTSLLQAQTFMLDFQAARWLMNSEVPSQEGNNHPTATPTGTYKTRDGYINIGVAGHTIWERLCHALDRQAWLNDPDFVTNDARMQNRTKLDDAILSVLKNEDSETWIARLNEAGVASGPIYAIDQLFADQQVRHLGIASSLQKPGADAVSYVAQPVELMRTPSRIVSHPPDLGASTRDVLMEIGYSEDDLISLKNDHVI